VCVRLDEGTETVVVEEEDDIVAKVYDDLLVRQKRNGEYSNNGSDIM
jgi:hypothetical protein